jgi:hypothetical protein
MTTERNNKPSTSDIKIRLRRRDQNKIFPLKKNNNKLRVER